MENQEIIEVEAEIIEETKKEIAKISQPLEKLWYDGEPYFEDEPIDGQAEALVNPDVFAPWMRTMGGFLKRVGAENGEDFICSVETTGMIRTYRIRWEAKTKLGLKYLEAMAQTFGQLCIGMEKKEDENSTTKCDPGRQAGRDGDFEENRKDGKDLLQVRGQNHRRLCYEVRKAAS